MAQQRKKKRRRDATPKKKKGVMMGMRSGFKKAARGVGVGVDKDKAPEKKKNSWLSTAFTILLVIAAIAILYYRNR
jgi:hypothetical protein